jgi:predicted porin
VSLYMRSFGLASFTAIAVALPASGSAAQVYGKVIAAVENIDQETNTEDFWQVASYNSRFGVRGDLETDFEGLKAIYNLEWGVDVADRSTTNENTSSNNHITSRNQFIGLKGSFGEFVIGRNDTPLKRAQGKVDLFNDLDPDIQFMMAGGEIRSSNTFQYTTPKIAEAFSVSLMGRPGEQTANPPATPGTDLQNGLADAISLSLTYASGPLYLALARDSDIDGMDVDTTRVVAQWTGSNFGLGFLHQTADFSAPVLLANPLAETDDEEVVFFSAYYNLSDRLKLKLQTGTVNNYGSQSGDDGDTTTFGVDFNLSKKTILGFLVASREGGDNLDVSGSRPEALSRDTIGFNLEHNFD